ncbi:hypothetical protein B0T16DRAFT_413915 [Cercophora newfieldiana]|uniref:Secreted protein n=1 Tax=Cercophora newfieldiana TaxID=92897 RepID=A0AA39Y5X8_9PEZI|nr:hypothetical protein B0T16DRAFT_413915 [Cercophora newfieldiana]
MEASRATNIWSLLLPFKAALACRRDPGIPPKYLSKVSRFPCYSLVAMIYRHRYHPLFLSPTRCQRHCVFASTPVHMRPNPFGRHTAPPRGERERHCKRFSEASTTGMASSSHFPSPIRTHSGACVCKTSSQSGLSYQGPTLPPHKLKSNI